MNRSFYIQDIEIHDKYKNLSFDWIIFWSKCKHVLCFECLMKHAKNEIIQNKIPIFPAKNCHNEIVPNE